MKTTTYDGKDALASMKYGGYTFSICADVDQSGHPVNVWSEALPDGSVMPFTYMSDVWEVVEKELPNLPSAKTWEISGELKKQAAKSLNKLAMLADNQDTPFGKEYEPN